MKNKLTYQDLENISKFIPESEINLLLNYQKIVDLVCSETGLTEKELLSYDKKGKSKITYGRMLLTVLTFKIFDSKAFNENVFNKESCILNNYVNKILYLSYNKDRTIPRYYLNLFRNKLFTKDITIQYIETLEKNLIYDFKYIEN